ncbi:MAG: hypothetical protein ACLQLG_09030 [Thermoguttaceae bacterium]
MVRLPSNMFLLRKAANGFSGATAGLPSSVVGQRIGTAGQASSGTQPSATETNNMPANAVR